ncbi:MAG: hypothetical protein ACREV3_02465 [Gammaproteobacteria bacterium]
MLCKPQGSDFLGTHRLGFSGSCAEGEKEDRGKKPRSKQNGREGREYPFCNDPIGCRLEYFREAPKLAFADSFDVAHVRDAVNVALDFLGNGLI